VSPAGRTAETGEQWGAAVAIGARGLAISARGKVRRCPVLNRQAAQLDGDGPEESRVKHTIAVHEDEAATGDLDILEDLTILADGVHHCEVLRLRAMQTGEGPKAATARHDEPLLRP